MREANKETRATFIHKTTLWEDILWRRLPVWLGPCCRKRSGSWRDTNSRGTEPARRASGRSTCRAFSVGVVVGVAVAIVVAVALLALVSVATAASDAGGV